MLNSYLLHKSHRPRLQTMDEGVFSRWSEIDPATGVIETIVFKRPQRFDER